jgi:hypothetical protein
MKRKIVGYHLDPESQWIAFPFRFLGLERVHNTDEIMAETVAKRLVERLERAGFGGHEEAAARQAGVDCAPAPRGGPKVAPRFVTNLVESV